MTATSSSTAAGTAAPDRRAPLLDWVGLATRLVLGGVLLWAGLAKLPDLRESVLAVRAYKILPYDFAAVVGYVLPVAEVAVGALLVLGLFTRVAGAIGALFMVAFIIGISWAWSQGYSIDCGCFGGGGQIAWEEAQAKYPWEIARDVGLFLCGAFLTCRPHTPYALESWLFRTSPAQADPSDDLFDHEESPA